MLEGFESSLSELGLNVTFLVIIIIWTIFWKMIALWHSARRGHIVWFVIMALFNTIGIIPILYLFIFKDLKLDKEKLDKEKKIKKSTEKEKSKKATLKEANLKKKTKSTKKSPKKKTSSEKNNKKTISK